MSRNPHHPEPTSPRGGSSRPAWLAAAAAVVAALVASLVGVPAAPAGADSPVAVAVAGLTVSTTRPHRGDTFTVAAPPCADEFQYVEARLVVGRGASRRSAALGSAWSGPVTLTVPSWAPTGPAVVEASCQEPSLSMADDGADIRRADLPPVAVTISAGSGPGPAFETTLTVRPGVTDGALRVAGQGCRGTVTLAVARGRDLVGSATRYRYGRTSVTADADGRWGTTIPLRYAVGEFSDPVAPGPMVLFASCGPISYPPGAFRIARSSPPPAINVLPWDPSGVYVAQCSPANTLRITARVTRTDGSVAVVTHEGPGHEYGERFQWLSLPSDAEAVAYSASCRGLAGPAFDYAPATWPAP